MTKRAQAEHGIVCRLPDRADGYMGWPSVARLMDGSLAVGCSGFRRYHVDPWGKTVLILGDGQGRFGPPRVVNDSPLDDRDVGVTALDGNRLLLSWFTLDTRIFSDSLAQSPGGAAFAEMREYMKGWDESTVARHAGSWTMLSTDGGRHFQAPVRCPVSAPHGPIQRRDGSLLYLGKQFLPPYNRPWGNLSCAVSEDGAKWREIGQVELPEGKALDQFHEPHVAELPDGSLLCLIRYHYTPQEGGNLGIYETRSRDGGKTWSLPRDLGFQGSPPHLLWHSSGALVLSYGYRHPGYGQRARISRDFGASWSEEWILRDDGPDDDLGYPCSVELENGDIFTVYYQKYREDTQTSLLWTRWRLEI